MKRAKKTKRKKSNKPIPEAQLKLNLRTYVDEAVSMMIPICYVAMKDEFGMDVEKIRKWKMRVDRYSDYLSNGLITFDDITNDLLKAGFYK